MKLGQGAAWSRAVNSPQPPMVDEPIALFDHGSRAVRVAATKMTLPQIAECFSKRRIVRYRPVEVDGALDMLRCLVQLAALPERAPRAVEPPSPHLQIPSLAPHGRDLATVS